MHVLRKPLSEGTVAANTMKHGCGGLNIDASRVGTTDNLNGGAYAIHPTHRAGEDMWTRDRKGDTNCFKRGGAGDFQQPMGRWPANVILQHLDGCRQDRVGEVVNPSGRASGPTKNSLVDSVRYGTASGERGDAPFYGGADGKETVTNWVCAPGCVVPSLDEHSGTSRYFKQVGGK